jgi:CelD/BcsL family acetyltransferase involved in cellulose biosynthesis
MDETITEQQQLKKGGNNNSDSPLALQGEFIQGKENIKRLANDWDDLFERAKDAHVYLSRAWLETFIDEDSLKGIPCIIAIWKGPTLVALLPLAVYSLHGIRIAKPIGSIIPSYLGILLDPDYPEAIKTITEFWIQKKVAHVFNNKYLSSLDTATQEFSTELKKHGFICLQDYERICHWIKLGCSFDEYFKKKASSKSRQNLLRRERRLFESGNVRVEHYEAAEVTQEIILRIAAVEEKSWLKRRGAAMLQRSFYQKLLLKMAHAGIGHVWLMNIDGEDAAFEYVLISHKRLQFGWRAFSLKYTSSMSTGQILMMHTIRDACNNGILSMDIGHGEADYKSFWADPTQRVIWVVAGRGVPGYLVVICYRVVWWLAGRKSLFSLYRRMRRRLNFFEQQ